MTAPPLPLQKQYVQAKHNSSVSDLYALWGVQVRDARNEDFALIDQLVETTYAPHLVRPRPRSEPETSSVSATLTENIEVISDDNAGHTEVVNTATQSNYLADLKSSQARADSGGDVIALTILDTDEETQKLIGTITVIKVDDENTPYRKIGSSGESELRFNAVAEAYQGLGFSKLLLEHAREIAVSKHSSTAMVAATMPTMEAAQALYHRSEMIRLSELDHVGFDGRIYPGFRCDFLFKPVHDDISEDADMSTQETNTL